MSEALNADGQHFVTSLRDLGALGDPDYQVLRRCIDQDFVLVTQDAQDFRNLASREEVHAGLIILPNLDRHRTETLLREAINHLDDCGDPTELMVNRVLEMDEKGNPHIYDLP